MLAGLQEYYKNNKISAIGFDCPFYTSCSRFTLDTFTTAKEAFISTGYEKHDLPRLLFLSLDSGSADTDPAKKTLESIRHQEEFECRTLGLPRHKHWFRTHELAHILLRNFKQDLRLDEVKHYFAHTNSAKCCQNNPGRKQAVSTLFDNCRKFISGEIRLLLPEILVTQGSAAQQVVQCAFEQRDLKNTYPDITQFPEEIKIIEIQENAVLWIHTYHPRNPNSKKNRDNYQIYEKLVYEFILRKPFPGKPIAIHERSIMNSKPGSRKIESDAFPDSLKKDLNYIFLEKIPDFPPQPTPTQHECDGYQYMTMVQLCNIAEKHGRTRGFACNAFGGDKGKYRVEPNRMARAVMIGNKLRKFVLVSAVKDFLSENNIKW